MARTGRIVSRLVAAVAAAVTAFAAPGAAPAAPAPAPTLPNAIHGTITWEYAKGEDNTFGNKSYDFGETFTWSGDLTNQTPGSDTNARYVNAGGRFGYQGTQTVVTTPQQNCDLTTTNTRAYGGTMTSADDVTLLVYLDQPARAVLSADCGATDHQVTVLCGNPPSALDLSTFRSIAHGDSGGSGTNATVKTLPGGKLDVSFDSTIGSKTGRPFEYERLQAHFVVPVPCKLDLAAKGVSEADEESTGALVIRNFDGNDAPRVPVVMKRVKGLTGDVLLDRVSSRLRVFTAPKGGTEIAFDGSSNRFAGTSLPKTLYVEGYEQSEAMRDASLTLSMVDDPECKDTVKFTVLWVGPPQFRLTSGESFSPDDSAAPQFAAAQGDDHAGYHRLSKTSAIDPGPAWTTETRALVHPHAFDYPGVVVAVAHSVELQLWGRAAGSTKIRNVGRTVEVDVRSRKGNNLLQDFDRDDDPDPDDMIYNLNEVGISDAALPAGSVARVRSNVHAAAYLLKGKHAATRCSELRGHWLRFSVTYVTAGSTTAPQLLADVSGDNDAQEGADQPLSFDLK